ncbi:hypothetical protein ACQPT2_22375 [Erwinia amylovora]
MRDFIIAALCLIPIQCLALTNSDIVIQVSAKIERESFPKSVEVVSFSEVNFYPADEDSSYARFGNVCGKVSVANGKDKVDLVFIAKVTEKNSIAMIETPTLYDISKQGDIARADLSKRCK